MRRTSATLLALLLAVSPSAGQEAGESERDVAALAPGQETATTLIVDALTRMPVPGARITWYAETEGLRAPALGTAVAGVHGLASLDWTELATWDADGHFLVTADGYAAAHAYGKFPPAEMELQRGRDVTARVVDTLGRPVADADVEVFLGCGHGPVLDFVTTDADGRFTVRGQDVGAAQLWVETPGVAADYLRLDGADGLGEGERVLLLEPGGVAEGVILDSAGRPLEGVEVRSYQRHRGPVGMTDRRGRFRLVGVEDDASLYVSHPFAIQGWAILDGDRWRPGVPMRLRLTPWGFATETQEIVRVDVRVVGPDGRVLDMDVALLRDADGLAYDAERTEREGVLTFEVPPGIYIPAAADRFDPYEIEPTPIEARAGARLAVSLRADEALVGLRVVGAIPEDAATHVSVPGAPAPPLAELLGAEDGAVERTVPRDGPLVVTVEWLGRTWFFAAGPEREGVREVRVDLPPPRRILLPEALHGDVRLHASGVPCRFEATDDGTLLTFATGALVLEVDTGDARWHVPVTIPAEEGAEVPVVMPPGGHPRTIRIVPPEGFDQWATIAVTTADGGGSVRYAIVDGPVEVPFHGPSWIRIECDDHAVWQTKVEEPGDVPFAWGDASLSFHVVDDGGDHVQTTVLVDGVVVPQRDPDDFSVVRVLGLRPGAHTVLLLPRDDAFFAKELHLELAPQEARRLRVELTLR